MSSFNPLLDGKRERAPVTANLNNPLLSERTPNQMTPVVANAVPVSPITNKPMTQAFCGDIPVFVDLETKVVLPIRD